MRRCASAIVGDASADSPARRQPRLAGVEIAGVPRASSARRIIALSVAARPCNARACPGTQRQHFAETGKRSSPSWPIWPSAQGALALRIEPPQLVGDVHPAPDRRTTSAILRRQRARHRGDLARAAQCVGIVIGIVQGRGRPAEQRCTTFRSPRVDLRVARARLPQWPGTAESRRRPPRTGAPRPGLCAASRLAFGSILRKHDGSWRLPVPCSARHFRRR